MRTDTLITMLATGAGAVAPGALRRRYLLAMGAGTLASAALMAFTLGLRADLAAAMALPMFWLKFAFAGSVAGVALVAAMRLSRPGARIGYAPQALALPVLAMWAAAAGTLTAAEPERIAALLLGQTWAVCPLLIAMLSAPVFAMVLWAMRGLAPTRLRLAGAAAGLLAGGTGAFVYCLHCPEMDAPFLGIWYLIGMLIPAAAGALLGRRLLRW